MLDKPKGMRTRLHLTHPLTSIHSSSAVPLLPVEEVTSALKMETSKALRAPRTVSSLGQVSENAAMEACVAMATQPAIPSASLVCAHRSTRCEQRSNEGHSDTCRNSSH